MSNILPVSDHHPASFPNKLLLLSNISSSLKKNRDIVVSFKILKQLKDKWTVKVYRNDKQTYWDVFVMYSSWFDWVHLWIINNILLFLNNFFIYFSLLVKVFYRGWCFVVICAKWLLKWKSTETQASMLEQVLTLYW